MELVLEQQGNCRAEGGSGLGGAGLEQQGSFGGEGGGRCCRGAAETRECSGVISVHSGQ